MAANRKTLDTDLIYLREIYARTPFNQTIPANQVLVSNGDDSTRWDYVGASSFRSVTGDEGATLYANNNTTELKVTTAGPPGLLDSYVDLSEQSLVLRATPPVLAISERPVPIITGAVALSPPSVKQIRNYSTLTMIGVKDVLLSTVTVNGAPPAIFVSISSFTSAGYSTISGEAFAWRPYLYNVLSTAQSQPTFTSSMTTTWATGVQNISTAEAYPDYITGDAYFSTVSFNMGNYIGAIRPNSQVILEVEPTYLFPRFLLGSEEYPTLLKNISSYIEYSGASTSILNGSMNSDMIVSQQSNAYTSNVFNKHMKMPIDPATILDNWATDGATGYYTLYHRIPGGMAELIPGDACGYYIGQRGGMSNAEPTYTNATPIQNGVFMSIYNTIPFPLSPEELEAQIRVSPAPGGFSTGTIGQTEGTISWQGAVGAIGYEFIVNGVTITPTATTFQLFSFSSTIAVTTTGKTATFTGLEPGVTYSIVVVAIAAGGGQTRSTSFYLTTRPSPPTNLALVSTTSTSFTASWTEVPGATGYEFTLNGIPALPYSYTSSSATFTTLTPNTTYILGFSAKNVGGSTPSETGLSVTTAPAAPNSFSAIIGTSTITLNWSGAEGATGFTYLVNGEDKAPVSQNTSIPYSARFTGLTPVTDYSFIVTAQGPSGSTDSLPYTVSTDGPPINLSSTVTNNSFTVSWMGSLETAAYSYTLNAFPPSQYGITVVTTGRTATFTGASPSTNYSVIVTASTNGVPVSSAPYSVTTLPNPPLLPVVTATNVTSTAFTLSWGNVNATSYSYTINGSFVSPSSTTSTSATFTNLLSATTYNAIVVTAINAGGSRQSAPISVTTATPPPTKPSLSFSNLASTVFTVQWQMGTGATSYIYTLNGNPPSFYSATYQEGFNTVTFFSLPVNTPFTVLVTARNNSGDATSDPLSVRTLMAPPTAPVLSSSAIGASGFTVSWPITGATSYTFTLDGVTVTPVSTLTSVTFSSLNEQTRYNVGVTARNNGGEATSFLYVTTLPTPPLVPVVTATNVTSTSFTLSWGNVNATSYSYTQGGNPITANSETATSATFTGRIAATLYSDLVVIATNAGGPVSSSPISVTTAAPGAPRNFTSIIGFTSLTIQWSGAEGATSFSYLVNGASVTPDTQGSNSATFTNLTMDTSYNFIVTAQGTSGNTDSAVYSVRTDGGPTPLVFSSTTVGGGGSVGINTSGTNWNILPLNNFDVVDPSMPTAINAITQSRSMTLVGGYNFRDSGLVRSFDFTTWSVVNLPNVSRANIEDIVWNESIWVACGSDGTTGIGNHIGLIATSSDGTNWTLNKLGGPQERTIIYSVAWNGSIWCAVGYSSFNYFIATSLDGTTWSSYTIQEVFSFFYGIAWNGSMWIAVGETADSYCVIAKSTNPLLSSSWTFQNINSVRSLNAIAWNGTRWIAGGFSFSSGGVIVTSSDGDTWSVQNISQFSGGAINSIKVQGTMAYAGGYSFDTATRGRISQSSDGGLSWSEYTLPPLAGQITCINKR
jgi:hypothetical protein